MRLSDKLRNASCPVKEEPTILFVCYGGGHVAMVIPVYRALRARYPKANLQVLGLTSAAVELERSDIPYFGFARLLQPDDDLAREYGEMLLIDTPNSGIDFAESVAYLGLSYKELVEQHGAQGAKELYQEYGRQAFFPARTMQHCLKTVEPDLVIATSAPRAERAAIQVAGELGVASLCMVDLFAFREVEWVGQNGFGSRVCVLSEAVKKRLISAGRDAHEVVVTGNPAFDQLRHIDVDNVRSKVRAQRKFADQFVILWASQPEPKVDPVSGEPSDIELPAKVEKILREFVERTNGLKLLIRYHPTQVPAKFIEAPDVHLSPRDEPVVDAICAADCVITFSSTVGLEAMILGVPVITVELSVTCSGAPYSKMGYSLGVKSAGELGEAISKVQKGEFTAPKDLRVESSAAESIVDEVEHILRSANAGEDLCVEQ